MVSPSKSFAAMFAVMVLLAVGLLGLSVTLEMVGGELSMLTEVVWLGPKLCPSNGVISQLTVSPRMNPELTVALDAAGVPFTRH